MEVVYLNRDNAIDLALMADGAPVAASALSRVVLVLGATTLDSAVLGFGADQPFDCTRTQSATIFGVSYPALSSLRLTLGHVSGLAAGDYTARLITYDDDHPNGLVWTEALEITVRA